MRKTVSVLLLSVLLLGLFVQTALAISFVNSSGAGYLAYRYDNGGIALIGNDRHKTSSGDIAYCANFNKKNPGTTYSGTFALTQRIKQVLSAGYPTRSGSAYGVTDDQLRYCTQIAIWVAYGQVDVSRLKPSSGGTATGNKLISLIRQLSAGPASPASLTVSEPASKVPVKYQSYYRVGPYKVTAGLVTQAYSVALTAGPSGAFIGTATAAKKTSFAQGAEFYLYFSATQKPKALSFTITTPVRKTAFVGYAPPSNNTQMQRIITAKAYNENTKVSRTVNYNTIEVDKTAEDGIIANVQFRFTKVGGGYSAILKTDSKGHIITPPLPNGDYLVEEINVPSRYVRPAAQKVKLSGDKTHFSFKVGNKLVKGNVKITKHDKDDPNTYVSDTEYKVYHQEGTALSPKWELYSTSSTDASGTVVLKSVPFGEYYVVESRPAKGYLLEKENQEPRYWSVKAEGDFVCEDYYNEREKIGCSVKLSTIRRTQEKDIYRYDITNIRNTSNTVGDRFFLTDVIDTSKVRLVDLYTGIYKGDDDGLMEVQYKTNKNEWRTWKASVPTTKHEHLFVSDLGLTSDEYVVAFRFLFDGVDKLFGETSPVSYFVSVLPGVTKGDTEQTIQGDVGVEIQRSDMTAFDDDKVETRLIDTLKVKPSERVPEGFGKVKAPKPPQAPKAPEAPKTGDAGMVPYALVAAGSLTAGAICAQQVYRRHSKKLREDGR